MSEIDRITSQLRDHLKEMKIKLWREPYYKDNGCVEDELDKLADNFSENLGIPKTECKLALTKIQESALRQLAARKDFEIACGMATLNIHLLNNDQGTEKVFEVKCPLEYIGYDLQDIIARTLDIIDESRLRLISAGKLIDPKQPLEVQNVKNNQQIMAIYVEVEGGEVQHYLQVMYDHVENTKRAVKAVIDSTPFLYEYEDEDDELTYLPYEEKRSLLLAIGYYERATAATKDEYYDEALILHLEADAKFSNSNSEVLQLIEYYFLNHLGIVWCYLCLKNITQLPDAERRLDLCEESFHNLYGENLEGLRGLKNSVFSKKALVMRLHLLQGVVYFHQNRRNEALEKFILAETELEALKVDGTLVDTIVEMGYEPFEARLALRCCNGELESSINFIKEKRDTLDEAYEISKKEREEYEELTNTNEDKDWVDPQSVYSLIDMGFERALVVEALKRCDNDQQKALDLLQNNFDELREDLPSATVADEYFLRELVHLGFEEDRARIALETTHNDLEYSIEFILRSKEDIDDESDRAMSRMAATAMEAYEDIENGMSTISPIADVILRILARAEEIESSQVYDKYAEEIYKYEDEYLADFTVVKEEQILAEYKLLLEE